MNASHSGPVIFMSLCDSYMERPVYFCGPPAAQQTISVTKYLNPAGGTRWCASSTRGIRVQSRVDHDTVNEVIDDGGGWGRRLRGARRVWGWHMIKSYKIGASFSTVFGVLLRECTSLG